MIRISAVFFLMSAYTAHADTTVVAIPLSGGTSAVGAFTLASVYGQSSTLASLASSTAILEPGFLCVEDDDLPIPGDFNGDSRVNGIDLAVILGSWGACSSNPCAGDVNHDDEVNASDITILLSNWG